MIVELKYGYCMNLDNRPDRWAQVVKDFQRLQNVMPIDIERVSAVKGEKFPQQGVTDTFKKIITLAKEMGLEYVLIMEDDLFVVDAERVKKCLENAPDEWDILLGGVYMYAPKTQPMCPKIVNGVCRSGTRCRGNHSPDTGRPNEYWMEIGDFCSLHFTIVRATIYDEILKIKGNALHLDRTLGKLSKNGKFKVWVMHPMPCQQRPGFSDLRGRRVDDNKKKLPWVDHPDAFK